MHQDQRVGLALGVLLVGACAAFFFRNETRTAPKTPQLQHAQELDDRIAERSTRPYLKGIEAVETADRRRSPSTVDPAHANEDQDAATWSPLDSTDDKFSKSKRPQFHRPSGKPFDRSNEVQELAPIAIPNDSQFSAESVTGVDATPIDSPEITTGSHSKSVTADGRTHVVQKGETLSSIAAKTLGSPNRFNELFEANQDQLKDPNDVKLGMTLRIPNARIESASKPLANKARPSVERESSADSPSITPADLFNDFAPPPIESSAPSPRNSAHEVPTTILMPPNLSREIQPELPTDLSQPEESEPSRKFVPARRTPLPGRTIGPQTKNSGQRDLSGRKLSQVSLESTSGKVAR